MHLKILAIVLSAACVLGCKDSASTKKPSLTNDELLQLMEGELFEVKVPDSIKSDQFAGLAIRHSNGTIDTFSSSNGWVPGETVKVVCFSPKKNVFRYAYFRESGSGSGSTSNFPITQQVSANMKKSGLKEGEQLIRCSKDNSVTIAGAPQGDDFDVVFHVQERTKGEQDADGNPH